MARLPLLDPDTAAPDAAELLTRIAGERGQAFNVYRMLANSPGALAHVYGLAAYLWQDSALPPRLTELVILRVAQLTGSDYEWARHVAIARRIGLTDREIDAVARWRQMPDRFDDAERAALELTEQATRGVEASAASVAAVRSQLGDQATLELTVLVGFYGMVSRLLRSLAVDPEPGDGPLPR
jgi:AhpD family alkylhydroperoxidase